MKTVRTCAHCGNEFLGDKRAAASTCSRECRFWTTVDRSAGPDSCWPSRLRKRGGYGQASRNGRMTGAHRLAYEFSIGAVPDSLFVLHRCDNRPCCNPAHLFVGTNADNMADMVAKGRSNKPRGDANGSRKPGARLVRGDEHWTRASPDALARGDAHWSRKDPARRTVGERHGRAVLTEGIVRQVRSMAADGISCAEIGRRLGLSTSQAWNVATRRTWAHVA